MIFETLYRAALNGELILGRGALCHWHLRQDGQLTIREIIVLPQYQRQGLATTILEKLKNTPGATSIFAKCPADLEANHWYKAMGFQYVGLEETKTGRRIRSWRLPLS